MNDVTWERAGKLGFGWVLRRSWKGVHGRDEGVFVLGRVNRSFDGKFYAFLTMTDGMKCSTLEEAKAWVETRRRLDGYL